MIIIKTKDGDHFINEKEVIEVAHDKNSATVFYYGQKPVAIESKMLRASSVTTKRQTTR